MTDARKTVALISIVFFLLAGSISGTWAIAGVLSAEKAALEKKIQNVDIKLQDAMLKMVTQEDMRDLKSAIDSLREEIKVARLELRDRR
jgi:hypothetical protein